MAIQISRRRKIARVNEFDVGWISVAHPPKELAQTHGLYPLQSGKTGPGKTSKRLALVIIPSRGKKRRVFIRLSNQTPENMALPDFVE